MKLQLVAAKHVESVSCKSVPVADRMDVMATAIPQMANIMYRTGGVGLAASQVGIAAKFFLAKLPSLSENKNDPRRVCLIFDPEYTGNGRKRNNDEGCLTYPKNIFTVKRYKQIKVKYTNLEGGVVTAKLRGDEAIIFQHECDHVGNGSEPGRTIKELQA